VTAPEGYKTAIALVGARLRGDAEGEQALTPGCDCGCGPLIEGLLEVSDISIRAMAAHDKTTPAATARLLDKALRRISGVDQ
jgi:hypothetical protein